MSEWREIAKPGDSSDYPKSELFEKGAELTTWTVTVLSKKCVQGSRSQTPFHLITIRRSLLGRVHKITQSLQEQGLSGCTITTCASARPNDIDLFVCGIYGRSEQAFGNFMLVVINNIKQQWLQQGWNAPKPIHIQKTVPSSKSNIHIRNIPCTFPSSNCRELGPSEMQ